MHSVLSDDEMSMFGSCRTTVKDYRNVWLIPHAPKGKSFDNPWCWCVSVTWVGDAPACRGHYQPPNNHGEKYRRPCFTTKQHRGLVSTGTWAIITAGLKPLTPRGRGVHATGQVPSMAVQHVFTHVISGVLHKRQHVEARPNPVPAVPDIVGIIVFPPGQQTRRW